MDRKINMKLINNQVKFPTRRKKYAKKEGRKLLGKSCTKRKLSKKDIMEAAIFSIHG